VTVLVEPETPDCSPLPATEQELRKIRQIIPNNWLTGLGETPSTPATVQLALQHLQESSIVHFACHGHQDLHNPLDSSLILTDGQLKVSELMRGNHRSSRQNIRLAFLSACETAKGDESLPDEAMHLASTMMFVGFHGVVATMWFVFSCNPSVIINFTRQQRRMRDDDGPKIAETFYGHLFKNCNPAAESPILPDLTKAAEALHFAVAELRKDPDVPFSRWATFVHYGL
jgi:hypothetical protein